MIGQILYSKRFDLTVDRGLCKGCDVCKTVCPREAISLKAMPRGSDGKARAPIVDIAVEKCDFHDICGATCPFGAITVSVDGQKRTPAVEKECYPSLLRHIVVNSDGCEPECKVCEERCPLKVIHVRFESITAEEAKARGIKLAEGKPPMRTVVDVDKAHCACCKVCEAACPAHVISVEKFFTGNIRIRQEKCPEGCHDCLDVCPVNALYMENGKVYPNDEFCIYCNACLNVCPQPEALQIKRVSVRHTPVKSGAWNISLERLTSSEGIRREFTAKRLLKAREALKNLPIPSD
ncbi:MAG: 4Fe-4S dicluster domain-containing protein [Nitrososphaerota archaeon]